MLPHSNLATADADVDVTIYNVPILMGFSFTLSFSNIHGKLEIYWPCNFLAYIHMKIHSQHKAVQSNAGRVNLGLTTLGFKD